MKVIRKSLFKEFLLNFVGAITVLTLVLSSTRIIRYLASVAQGELPGDAVAGLMMLKLLWAQTIIIPVALFLAALLALGRWYRDSEMTALYAAGISPRQMLWPVGFAGLVATLPVALLSFFLAPWAEEQTLKIEERIESQPALTGISSGVFRPLDEGRRIFYVQQLSEDRSRMENVFIRDLGDAQSETIIAAPTGRVEIDQANGDQFLVLENGYRYDGLAGELDFKRTQFSEYALLIRQAELKQKHRKVEALPTMKLLDKGLDGIAELQWRIAVPLSTLLLMLLAVPLSYSAPRSGRAGRLAVAMLVYLFYTNMLKVSASWISDDKLSPWIGLWWVHLLVVVLFLQMMISLSNPMVSWPQRMLGWVGR